MTQSVGPTRRRERRGPSAGARRAVNTLNRWAAGISDTLALGLITEAVGLQLPLVALQYLNRAQAAHPALDRSVSFLRERKVTVPLGDDGFIPHVPKQGNIDAYPWDTALAALPG